MHVEKNLRNALKKLSEPINKFSKIREYKIEKTIPSAIHTEKYTTEE